MRHCIMKTPPDGTECGGMDDTEDQFVLIPGNSTHGNGGSFSATHITDRNLGLIMNADLESTDTELSDGRVRGIMTMGTGACGTELEDLYRAVFTMGGEDDDEEDAAARFTLIDTLSAAVTTGSRQSLGFAGDEYIYEDNRPRELVTT